jgi:hypothetical protein
MAAASLHRFGAAMLTWPKASTKLRRIRGIE